MPDVNKVQELADAAANLCAAYDELAAAGYGGWSSELRELIDIIGAEIDWLQHREPNSVIARPKR